jgi:hypothetical protein
VGAENYYKDLKSLDHAETFTSFLIAHPDKVSGKVLVAVLSYCQPLTTSQSGSGLRHMIVDKDGVSMTRMTVAAEALNDCQKSIFNAGDDFVELVMNYVGAEEEVVGRTKELNH